MTVVFWYLLFALTTSIVATLDLLHPVVKLQPKPVKNLALIYIVFFVNSLVIAPLLIFSCLIPTWGERAKEGLAKGLFPKA
jgi:hypothetical protein